MKLTEIKAMFVPGQKWHALRKDNHPIVIVQGNVKPNTPLLGKHRDEVRTVEKIATKDLVFKLNDGKLYYTAWPKASEVIEARDGFLKFTLNEGQVEVTLQRLPVNTGMSKCCGAPVKVEGNTTQYYVCEKCNQACDKA